MPCDYKNYPDNWFTEIRPRILKRDNNCCKKCGLKNYDIIKREKTFYRYPCQTDWDMIHSRIKNCHSNMSESLKYHGFVKIVLTIAHLNHDTTDNRDENLAALCQKCHNNYDKHYRAKNRKLNKGQLFLF